MVKPVNSQAGRFRDRENLLKLSKAPKTGRLPVVNHLPRAKDLAPPLPPGTFAKIASYVNSRWVPWVASYLKYAFNRKYPFASYKKSGFNGIYKVPPENGSDVVKVSIAGDWATGTYESCVIAERMLTSLPDLTIHLGDVYYVGDEPEVQENCNGVSSNGRQGVRWPKGRQGSFALNGNHEMYANGDAYFKSFLPTLGMRGDRNGQIASYFCLEIGEWRVIGLDTGYNSTGVPILSRIPLLNKLKFLDGNCRLEDDLIDWLRKDVRPKENQKPTLLLSHHQYFTAFPDESDYHSPAEQLAEFFSGRDLVWLWGHEHRLGIYGKNTTGEELTVYGRCIGHGGMPIELQSPDPDKSKNTKLMYYDTREYETLDNGEQIGKNGFVRMTVKGNELALEYYDINDALLHSEKFIPGPDGKLQHSYTDYKILTKTS